MTSWNKGLTKDIHPSLRKTSQTMRRKRIDNFGVWREQMKAQGFIKSSYPLFERTNQLAELIGVILGDGHIEEFPRTERLYISAHSKNKGFIERYRTFLRDIFQKEPHLMKMKGKNCVRLTIYEKYISKRLGIPCGNKKSLVFFLPSWIKRNKALLTAFLRGLYEAEGSHCVHRKSGTYKLLFSNKNENLLDIVFTSLKKMGFHPNKSGYKIQISRRKEVEDAIAYLKFRKY